VSWWLLLLLPAGVIHEFGHALAATLFGDSTPKEQGRLTLNPLRHVDPFGTVALPLLTLLLSWGTLFFGYMKPVHFDPDQLPDDRWSPLFVALAGAGANLAVAGIAGLGSRLVESYALWEGLYWFVTVNLLLAFLNLIPVPPLDGGFVWLLLPDAVFEWLMRPLDALLRVKWLAIVMAFVLGAAAMWFAPTWYFEQTVWPLQRWLMVAG